jgi:hypothetical protein
MIWPAMVFNLCVGLLFAGFLLRAVRRFERRADAIMAKIDRRHEENMREYDIARDEIKASMRTQVDRAIAESQLQIDLANAELQALANHDGPAAPADSSHTEPVQH